jgi:hypothetical protein
MLRVPALGNVSSQPPAATVPVHEVVPSLTITSPVGVPTGETTV